MMGSSAYRPNYVGELLEVITLDPKLMFLEERNYPLQELNGAVHHVDLHRTSLAFGSDSAAAEELLKFVQDRSMVTVLRDLKGGLDLPATRRAREGVALNG
jgi:hypothetical protein